MLCVCFVVWGWVRLDSSGLLCLQCVSDRKAGGSPKKANRRGTGYRGEHGSGSAAGAHALGAGHDDRGARPQQILRSVRRGAGRLVLDTPGAGGRVSRAERGRQDHADADAHRLPGAQRRPGGDCRLRRPRATHRGLEAARLPAGEWSALSRHDPARAAAVLRRGAGAVAGHPETAHRRGGRDLCAGAGAREADREALQGLQTAGRAGAGAVARPRGVDHGRADRRARPEPDQAVPRQHPAAGADQDPVDLDPHSAGGRGGGRPGPADS